jgi:hypothetical protein
LNTCGHILSLTSSLTRGWVCRLQLLLMLASAVILRSHSRGTHDHILLSQIRDSPNVEIQVPVFISPRNRVAQLYPQAMSSLSDSQGYVGENQNPTPHHGRPVCYASVFWPPFTTFREPCRKHLLKVFPLCCFCMLFTGNVFSSMVTEHVQQRTSIFVDSVTLGDVFS